ncbi:MAG: FliH/SctL family protein [Candidatus Sericytochromatia bacterium]
MSSDRPRILKQAPLLGQALSIGAAPSPSPPDPDVLKQARLEAQQAAQHLIQEAEQQAAALMREARSESVRLLNEAQQKVSQLEQQAWQEGLQRGETEGMARLQAALTQFQGVMQAALDERARLLAGAEAEMVHLVLQIVRKILRVEPLINEQTLIRLTRHALERLGHRVDVCIFVHPADIELLHFSLSQLNDLALEIVIEPDPQLSPGGCRITSRAGEVDASLETQFDAIARSFLALAEGSGDPLQ